MLPTTKNQTLQLIEARNLIAMLLCIHAQTQYTPTHHPLKPHSKKTTLLNYLQYSRNHLSFCSSHHSTPQPQSTTIPPLYSLYHSLCSHFPSLIAATLDPNPILATFLPNLISDLDTIITHHFHHILSDIQHRPPLHTHPLAPHLPFQLLIAATQPHLLRIPTNSSPRQLTRLASFIPLLTNPLYPPSTTHPSATNTYPSFPLTLSSNDTPHLTTLTTPNPIHHLLLSTLSILSNLANPTIPQPPPLTASTETEACSTPPHTPLGGIRTAQLHTPHHQQLFLVRHTQRNRSKSPWNPFILPLFGNLLQSTLGTNLYNVLSLTNQHRYEDLHNTPNDPNTAEHNLSAIFNTLDSLPSLPPTSHLSLPVAAVQTRQHTASVPPDALSPVGFPPQEPPSQPQPLLPILQEHAFAPAHPLFRQQNPASVIRQTRSSATPPTEYPQPPPVFNELNPTTPSLPPSTDTSPPPSHVTPPEHSYSLSTISYSYHQPSNTSSISVSCSLNFTPTTTPHPSTPLASQTPTLTLLNNTLFLCASYHQTSAPSPTEIQSYLHTLIHPLYLQSVRSRLQAILTHEYLPATAL